MSSALSLGLDLRTDRVRIQDPIAVKGRTGRYAPEVDIAVVTEKLYRSTPIADDSFAFCEVSDTTYADDREEKIRLYVESGVPAWHVNIPARQVEHYPRHADISAPVVFREGENFEILGVWIAVTRLFNPPE